MRPCQVDKCELCGLSSSRCLSCEDNLVGVNNQCNSSDLKTCQIANCQNCSLIEAQKLADFGIRPRLDDPEQMGDWQNTTSEICMKCAPGFSLSADLTCIETGEGCRIFDAENKRCLQCLFDWYMNSKFECSKGEGNSQ